MVTKKYILLIVLILCAELSFCQPVIINGIDNNRQLTWADFTGKPDNKSEHDANTYWNVKYSYSGFYFAGDTVKLRGFVASIELDDRQSWIKPGKETNNLLIHEQGHFNIGLLCQKEILHLTNNTIFFRLDWQNKLQMLFNNILSKYQQMATKYDEETDHSKKKDVQEKWNSYFAIELNR